MSKSIFSNQTHCINLTLLHSISRCLITFGLISSLIFSFNVNALEADKVKHLAASYGIGFISKSLIKEKYTALAVCIGVGVSKELYDEIHYAGFSGEDLLADVIGCSLGNLTADYLGFSIGLNHSQDITLLSFSIPY